MTNISKIILPNGDIYNLIDNTSGYALDNSVIHRTGNETVDGQKTYTDMTTFQAARNAHIRFRETNTSSADAFISLDNNKLCFGYGVANQLLLDRDGIYGNVQFYVNNNVVYNAGNFTPISDNVITELS